jgi:ferredoxin
MGTANRNFVFYHGPSMIDGAPIVAIAKIDGSRNSKTGAMVQTYILRADVAPAEASRRGLDISICGDCGHRGKYDYKGELLAKTRSCYVVLCHGPAGIYKAFKRGVYRDLSADLGAAADAIAGAIVRLGTYGDPAAVPFGAWQALLARMGACTGYTHQWRRFPEFAQYCMASCDSDADRTMARALGFRTFRVAPKKGWVKEAGEVLCPASAEAGKRTNCIACKACGGHSAKARADIVIPAHGTGAKLVPAAA